MDNIEFLLQSLNSETDGNNDTGSNNDTHSEILSILSESKTENTTSDSSTSIRKHDTHLNVSDSVFKSDYDFEITKKQLSSKYSVSGNEIHKKLKENEKSRFECKNSQQQTWSSRRSQESSRELAVSSPSVKQDVYAEPVFGLRLINPLVSSSCIETKMAGRLPISTSNISHHLRCGDKSKDWVFAGAVVFKSGLKTSQKGSQYCLWKISDLKQDLKQVTLYLFGKACSELWKVSLGTVAAVLNATPFHKDEKASHDEVTLTIKSADQVMILGGSRDYGLCKALKKNGEKCTSFVNKNACEFCIFHIKKEYNKYAGTRSNLQAPSIGLANLRNKVLGKSEVFYAGKSYSAVNVPKRSQSDQKNPLAQKSIISAMSKKLRESDQRKLEKLSSPKNQCIDPVPTQNFLKETVRVEKSNLSRNDDANQSKTLPVSNESILQSKPENSGLTASIKSPLGKPVLSRLHLFKQAGAKMVESGQATRISAATKAKKTPCFSFADVLTEECPSPQSSQIDNIKENDIKDRKVALNKKESVIDLSVDIRKSLNGNSPSTISNTCKVLPNRKITSTTNGKNKSKTTTEYLGPSKILQDFKNLARNTDEEEQVNQQRCDEEDVRVPKFVKSPHEKQNSSSPNQMHNGKTEVKSFMQHLPSSSVSIHDMKKARAKQNAISLIKKQGGIKKVNPNQVRPEPNQRRSVKRLAENSDTDDAEESVEKSVLSKRFVDLMNATSRHENLVEIAEDIERQDYFNKMEKKEQHEEKMLTTYKVPCKAVVCLKCKYKWFSASDLCRAEGHPIKVIDTVKRYFKCNNCTNRTVSLEVVPLISCKQCGSSKWSRAGMIKEKLARHDNGLSIRGDEVKYLDSLSHSMNINLLVPDDK